MEKYIRAIFPIIVLLRCFGFDLHPNSDRAPRFWRCCRLISLNILKIFQFFVLITFLILIVIQVVDYSFAVVGAMYMVMLTYGIFQSFLFRFIFGRNFQKLITLTREIDEIFQQFDGDEQSYLRRIRLLCKFTYFYTPYAAAEYCLFGFNILFRGNRLSDLDDDKSLNKPVALFRSIVFGGSFPYNYMFSGATQMTMFIQLLALKYVFQLLENYSRSEENTTFNRNKLASFIRLHRKACHLLEMANDAMSHLFLLKITVSVLPVFYQFVMWVEIKVEMALVSMGHLFLITTYIIIMSGLTNQLVYKSLKQCRQFVHCRKLAIKLELYETHIVLRKPCITLGNIATVKHTAIFVVLDFLGTYIAVLSQRYDKEDQYEYKV
ncbi:hypothetical protein CHUAL_009783 [Chamberlinius hualienensis]